MADINLNSVRIENFRAFRCLTIEKLGRVNLITGKNNVGKTSLLEALHLYSTGASYNLVRGLLRSRDEFNEPTSATSSSQPSREFWINAVNITSLFHGRNLSIYSLPGIVIGETGSPDRLSIRVEWYHVTEVFDETGDDYTHSELLTSEEAQQDEEAIPYLVFEFGEERRRFSLNGPITGTGRGLQDRGSSSRLIRTSGMNSAEVARCWDRIALQDEEHDVLTALRIIAPEVQRISLIGESETYSGRFPVVKLQDVNERVPLKRLGDGMNRLFGIALALVNAKNGLLLLDEIENGLHYTVQPDVWKMIFDVARRLNVQVFATTHSADCVRAFEKAASVDKNDEAALIRLVRQKEGIVAAEFNEEELEIAADNWVEVR